MKKKTNKIALIGMAMSLAICLFGCSSRPVPSPSDHLQQNSSEQAKATMAEWFTSQQPDYDILACEAQADDYIVLTGSKNPGVNEYSLLQIFVVTATDDGYTVSAIKGCDVAMSAGFSVAVLITNGRTIVFGDIAHSIYDFKADMVNEVQFAEAKIILSDGSEKTAAITNDSPYLVVFDGETEVSNIEYYGNELLAKYSEYHSVDILVDTAATLPNSKIS